MPNDPQPVNLSSDARSIGDFLLSCRSFTEYQAMFALTDADLAGRVLDCPGGGASFAAMVGARGGDAIAADPAYASPPADLIDRLDAELRRGSAWVTAHAHRYTWSFFGDLAEHDRIRTDSARLFSEDLQHHPDRYVTAALPELPFSDGEFDLVLSSHLLFTYADRLDIDFHLAVAVIVARSRSAASDALELVDIDYEFHRGARTMLELHAMGDRP